MAELGEYADRLEEMTEQEVVEVALTHLAEQGIKSVSEEGNCFYRGDNGLCCGAGPFVKDYKPEMESDGWRSVSHTLHQTRTIEEVQGIHDYYRPEEWVSEFKERFPDVDFSFLENIKIHENCRS